MRGLLLASLFVSAVVLAASSPSHHHHHHRRPAAAPRVIHGDASVLVGGEGGAVTGVMKEGERLAQVYMPMNKHLSSSGSNLPVGGDVWPVAIYWCDVQVGTPPVSFPVAMDTGSFTLDIPNYNCPSCITKAPNTAYNPAKSSTSSNLDCATQCGFSCASNTCSFSNSYQTCDLTNPNNVCTITGLMYNDTVSLAGYGNVYATFGTITSQTSNFDQFLNIDGVMGLAGATSDGNVFAAMVDAGVIEQDVFAMCFNEGATSNGTVTFGGIDPSLYTGQIAYTPNTGGSGAGSTYNVNLQSLTVFGSVISSAANQAAILDSGTNVLLLPSQPYADLQAAFQASCATNGTNLHGICDVPAGQTLFDGACYPFTQAQLEAFPDLSVNLQGVDLTMTWNTYLSTNSPLNPNQSYRCLSIRNTGDGGFTIIGDTTMYNYYVVFDRVNTQIGWAPVNDKNCGSIPLTHRK